MKTNGSVRFGTFLIFMSGVVLANGVSALDENLWLGIIIILLGVVGDGIGISKVESGIKEMMYVRDLEKATKK